MPYDGSGNFNRVMNWQNDAAAAIKIKADRHDAEDDNLAAGLSNAITKDGQTQPTANIPMNGKKLVNLGAPTNPTDAATKGYADSLRNFNTAINLTGAVPEARIGFTGADIGFGARVAGTPAGSSNRFVWNDKPDLSGTDIAYMNDTGSVWLASWLQPVGGIFGSGSTVNGLVLYAKTPAEANSGGHIGLRSNTTAGEENAVSFYTGGTGTAAFGRAGYFNADKQLIVAGSVTSNANAFIGASASVTLAATGAGQCLLRPNGWATAAGEFKVEADGDVHASGAVNSSGSFIGSATVGILASESAGTVYLRPNGAGSAVGNFTVASSGLATAQMLTVNTVSATGATSGWDAGNTTPGLARSSRNVATAVNHYIFYNPNGTVGTITTNGSATAYNTSSDERLKDFGEAMTLDEALAIIEADPVRHFTWKADGAAAVGWSAQQSHAISPDLASEGSGEPGEEDFMPWGMDQSKRTPYLWAATAGLAQQVAELAARVEQLEAAA